MSAAPQTRHATKQAAAVQVEKSGKTCLVAAMGKINRNGKRPGRGGERRIGSSKSRSQDRARNDRHEDTCTTGRGNGNHKARAGKRKRHRHHHAGAGPAAAAGASASAESASVMDDVMEQLRKQRAKAKAMKEKEGTCSSSPFLAETTSAVSAGGGEEKKRRAMGKFQYDPIKKAYFPVSSKRYNPNDVATFGDDVCSDDDSNLSLAGDGFDVDGMTSMGNDVEHVALRLSTGRHVNRVKKSKCSSHALLQSYHMAAETINSSALRRHRLRSEMASTLLFTNGIHLRPAVRRAATGRGGAGEWWQFLLEPLPHTAEFSRSEDDYNGPIPLDCLCKHELHPSARTFDVLKSNVGRDELPHIVTIIGGGQYGSSLYYRRNRPALESPFAFQASQGTNGSTDSSSPRRYQCVRFAPFVAESRLQNSTSVVLGALSVDAHGYDKNSTFTLHRGPTNSDIAMPFLTKELRFTGADKDGALMNDFVFSPNSTTAAPGTMAFAPALPFHRKKKYRPTFLDFQSMQLMTRPVEWKYRSEALCVEHLNCTNSNSLLYGHRNGSVSILDCRENALMYAGKSTDFGSVTSLESLDKVDKSNEFVAKGSFGACRLFDIRKLSNNNTKDNRSAPALVHEMFYLDTKPSQHLANASSGCAGMTVASNGTTLISPCMKGSTEPSVCLGAWNLSSGSFLREISLSSIVAHEPAVLCVDGATNEAGIGNKCSSDFVSLGSRYCEMVSSWDMNQIEEESMGAWIKFDPHLTCTAGGAIHSIAI